MIEVTEDFKTAMKQPIKEIDAYIELEDDSKLTSADDLISFKISCDTGMCKTAMRKLEAKYLGEHNLLGQWVHVGFGVKLETGIFEYLDYGSFLVTEITVSKDTDTTTIVGYDQMINGMKEYSTLNVEYPIRLLDYTKILCNACGLELGNNIFGKNEFDLSKVVSTTSHFNVTEKGVNLINCWTNQIYTIEDVLKTFKPNTTYTMRAKAKVVSRPSTILSSQVGTLLLYRAGVSGNPTIATPVLKMTDKETVQLNTEKEYITTFTTPENMDNVKLFSYTFYGNNDSSNTGVASGEIDISEIMLVEGTYTEETMPKYTPYYSMNDWEITQELWENIDGITYRDILVQIAQATGTTCIIGNNDKVYFKPLTDTGEQLTYDNMKKLKLEPIYGEINSIVLSRTPQEDNIYMRDDESIEENGLTEWKIENNEIIDKDRDNAMTPIYNALYGITYYPFETSTEGLGWYEIADSFNIINNTGDVFNTSLFNFSITIDGGIKETLKTIADTKTQTQYQYATTIAKRVKNTEIIVNKQEQYIENLVTDVYDDNGLIQENFTKIHQDISDVITSVQNTRRS